MTQERPQDPCVGVVDDDPLQQLVMLEDMLLLARYEEAAKISAGLAARFSKEGLSADAFLQRALVIMIQAQLFIGRQGDVDTFVGNLGLHRLAVPTFMAWALLLLESRQAGTARLRAEQYMSAIITLLRERQQAASAHNVQLSPHCRAASGPVPWPALVGHTPSATKPGAADPPTSSVSPQPGPEAVGDACSVSAHIHGSGAAADCVGAATATPQDRTALARLYSQDVLCLGLGLPLEALRWLQPSLPLSATTQQHQHQQQQQQLGGTGQDLGDSVDAGELVGSEEVLQRLQEELKQLIGISGMMPPLGLPDDGAAQVAGPAQNNAVAQVGASPYEASSKASQGQHGAQGTAKGGGASPRTCAGGTAGGTRSGVASQAVDGQPGPHSAQVLSGRLSPSAALSGFFRSLLASAQALMRRWFLGASVHLTRAQTWLICKAAAATSRLLAMSGGRRGDGGSGSSGTLNWLRGASLGRVAVLVAVAAVVLVAAQAEAPYLRTSLERQWGLLGGMVREALWMGLALHPSPVATSGAYPVH